MPKISYLEGWFEIVHKKLHQNNGRNTEKILKVLYTSAMYSEVTDCTQSAFSLSP